MIELSHYSLILAFILTLIPVLMAVTRVQPAISLAITRISTLLYSLLVLGAFVGLVIAYVTSDFSVLNVAENSHSTKPLLYKITGAWGNHEGSMLLWVLILSCYALALVITQRHRSVDWQIKVTAVQSALVSGFLLFVLALSNPFLRILRPPLEGSGLNPLLQDPSLAWHPPILYTGYLGFSVVFAMAIVGLWQQRLNKDWLKTVRPWTLWTWSFLTAGIGLGSWWAYYELGWGGWWFWDPVENASLLPWLLGIALIHRLLINKEPISRTTIILALSCFIASVLGTFLVRSGMISSVHSFALDPKRGLFILLLNSLVVAAAIIFFVRYAPPKTPKPHHMDRRFFWLRLNSYIFILLTLIIGLGTFYPLFHDIFTGQTITVGTHFYNRVVVPIGLLMGLGMMWVTIKYYRKRNFGMIISHAGFAILMLAIGVYEFGKQETTLILKPGQEWQLAHFHGKLEKTNQEFGKNYVADQLTLSVYRDQHFVTTLTPQMRFYPIENGMTIESDYHVGMFGQFYAAADRWDDAQQAWQVRLYWHPMLPFLWLGMILMIMGAGISWRKRG